MGATDSEMGAPEGLLSVFIISGLLLGTCLSKQACVDDACFDQSIQQLKIERSKTDQASGLNYRERSTDLVATIDVIGVCLPGVNPSVLADSFQSCSDEKVEEVCTMVKRGWLEDKERKSVVNENALLATFKGLNGGEDAVRECLQIPEVYEYEYYYYDYANYYDEYDYDYLEESASRSRQRRAAGDNKNGEKKAGNKKKKGQGKKNAKNNQKNAKKGGNGKGSKRNGKNKGKGKKGGNGKNGKGEDRKAERRAARKSAKRARKQERKITKAEKQAAEKEAKKAKKNKEKKKNTNKKKKKKKKKKKSSNGEKDARKKALSKLGLKKMPSKSTMEKLTCVQDKITELLIGCAKNILSKTN